MSLANRVREGVESSSNRRVECRLEQILRTLPQEDADALLELVWKRLDLFASDVERLVVEEGIDNLSQHTIGRHRRGQCAYCRRCGRGTL